MSNADQSARDFFSGLDRSALGFYAIPYELMIAAHSAESYELVHRGFSLLAHGKSLNRPYYDYGWEKDLEDAIKGGLDRLAIIAELYYWWKQNDYWILSRYQEPMFNPESFAEQTLKIEKVIAHPELHVYFKAGIWDIDTALDAWKNDIDSALVLAVWGNG